MTVQCSVEDCFKKVQARGWCGTHYARWRKHGDVSRGAKEYPKDCSIEGCDNPFEARGWCRQHYARWHKYGEPVRVLPNVEERFWAKVVKAEGCWEWTAAKDMYGYSTFVGDGDYHTGHRFSYDLHNETKTPSHIPIHHKCGNRGCVNPEHLQAVTPRENNAEMLERNFYLRRIAQLEALLDKNGITY